MTTSEEKEARTRGRVEGGDEDIAVDSEGRVGWDEEDINVAEAEAEEAQCPSGNITIREEDTRSTGTNTEHEVEKISAGAAATAAAGQEDNATRILQDEQQFDVMDIAQKRAIMTNEEEIGLNHQEVLMPKPPPATIVTLTRGYHDQAPSSECSTIGEEAYKKYKKLLDQTPYNRIEERLKGDKEISLAAMYMNGLNLRFAPDHLKKDKDVVIVACSQNGDSFQYASLELQNNKVVVLTACSQGCPYGSPLEYASAEMQKDKEVVLLACSQDGLALEYACRELQKDKDVVMVACSQDGFALQYALNPDKEIVLRACSQHGMALEHASSTLKADKDVVLMACSQDGDALKFASDSLRSNKEVVMAAIGTTPESLKFALGGLNQDRECLIKANIWDENFVDMKRSLGNKKKIVLSTKFSLAEKSSAHATKFTVELKKHPYITREDFVVYSPNAFNKGTCDREWTNKNWPCRGTFDSCRKPPEFKTGIPQERPERLQRLAASKPDQPGCENWPEYCWRYSFRYHLREASLLGGFMIQVVDKAGMFGDHSLGNGQMIETEMGQDVGIKIFYFYEPLPGQDYGQQMNEFVSQIQQWYEDKQDSTSKQKKIAENLPVLTPPSEANWSAGRESQSLTEKPSVVAAPEVLRSTGAAEIVATHASGSCDQVPSSEDSTTVVPQPGAFAGAPGEGLQRRDDIPFSLVGIHPPGEESTNSNTLDGLEDDAPNAVHPTLQTSIGRNRAPPSVDVLAEASPIEDNVHPDMEAQLHDVEAATRRKSKQANQQRKYFLVLCLVFAFIVVGAILGFVFHNRTKNSGITLAPTVGPSVVPTSFPSSAPSGALDLLREGLPNHTLESLKEYGTPQWEAWEWLMNHQNISNLEEWRKKQLFALGTFYYSFEGESWNHLIQERWMDDKKGECEWFSRNTGYFFLGEFREWDMFVPPCNDDGKITFLHLEDLELAGVTPTLPPEIALLTSLSAIILHDSDITASLSDMLPSELFQMTNLKVLDFSSNELNGTIPTEVGLMKGLAELHLRRDSFADNGNRLTGSLPSEFGLMTKLERLSLEVNDLSGQIPSEFGMMTKMTNLGLTRNTLTGPIPSELCLMTSMSWLFLSENGLVGSIPHELVSMTNMFTLDLGDNKITGLIPSELGLMTNMSTLDLGGNKITGLIPSEIGLLRTTKLHLQSNTLRGPLPSELGLMLNMTELSLSNNTLSFSIPSELGKLTIMETLLLQHNFLSGSIPSELGMITNMSALILNHNRLSGLIPSELANRNMVTLSANDNVLTGPLPSELGLMTSLTFLHLFNNFLTGAIPTQLIDLPTQWGVRLYGNNLTIPTEVGLLTRMTKFEITADDVLGPLPSELGFITSLAQLRLHKNVLTGQLPSQLGLMTNMTLLWLHRNHFGSSIPSELGTMTNMLQLYLYINRLTGSVPSELGRMTNMTHLELDENAMTGSIFPEVGSLTKTVRLGLSHNFLTGSIPSQLGLMTSATSFRLNDNTLTGTIPSELQSLAINGSLKALTATNNAFSGTVPEGLCSLGVFNSSTMMGLSFDCNDQLCGCCWCPCGEDKDGDC